VHLLHAKINGLKHSTQHNKGLHVVCSVT